MEEQMEKAKESKIKILQHKMKTYGLHDKDTGNHEENIEICLILIYRPDSSTSKSGQTQTGNQEDEQSLSRCL
jgi:hypothetical protein